MIRSPAHACEQTVSELGWPAASACEALRDIDHGDWTGRALETLTAQEYATWHSSGTAPGGEPFAEAVTRVEQLLQEAEGEIVAVTHQSIARIAIMVATGSPDSFWRIAAEPLSAVHVRRSGGGALSLHFPRALDRPW